VPRGESSGVAIGVHAGLMWAMLAGASPGLSRLFGEASWMGIGTWGRKPGMGRGEGYVRVSFGQGTGLRFLYT
jgi:hypothetical protein